MCKRPAGPAGLRVLATAIALSLLVPLAGSLSPARADDPYRAGVARVIVQGAVPFETVPFEVLVAYPTDVAEAPFEAGPWTIHASLNAPIAPAKAFPVLLFSHGDGRGGSPLPLRDLIAALARQGFIVIAPFHSGAVTGPIFTGPLRDRPRQLHQALDQVLADQRFAAQADRMGSSILSEVDNTSISGWGSQTRQRFPLSWLPVSRLLPPRSGLERSDFVPWPNAKSDTAPKSPAGRGRPEVGAGPNSHSHWKETAPP
jgi:hypothetical protein